MPSDNELPDIHWMEVNPAKRSIQSKLLRQLIANGTRVYPRRGVTSSCWKLPFTVVCLPGSAAWDIDYFLPKKGVGRIVGIERTPEVADALRQKFAGESRVEIFTGSVADYFLDLDFQVELIYLDYCSSLSLSVVQDIDIILRRRSLTPGGKCMVNLYNARENNSARVAHRLLFEELTYNHAPEEEWDDLEPDRRRCVAFNSALYRHRTRVKYPAAGERLPIGVSAVHQWYRYKTLGGSMLTGFFTLQGYSAQPHGMGGLNPDKWYVRDKYAIRDVKPPQNIGSLSRFSKKRGRNLHSDLIQKSIVDFYQKNGRAPSLKEVDVHTNNWNGAIREVGLCPNQGATLADIKGELRRIHSREGVVERKHLRRAHLIDISGYPSRRALSSAYGYTIRAFERLLDEMGLSHNLRT